jgi:hypothetical protein
MTRNEFYEQVEQILGPNMGHYDETGAQVVKTRTQLKVTWVSGGVGGGNCWTDGGHYALAAEQEPDFSELDEFLEQLVPDLSYLKYKKIEKLIEYKTKHDHEYYGNYTYYTTKTISLDALYEVLFT